jgi:putative NIF3 family GTP cyclohydrolase 1 type 2
MLKTREIVEYLDLEFQKSLYNEAIPSLWKDTQKSVTKIGLALEPWTGIEVWIEEHQLDGLFLHRPWKINEYELPDNISLFAYHLPFDEHLTIGYNLHLCRDFTLANPQIFGLKEGRPIGMVCETQNINTIDICKQAENVFQGVDECFQINNTNVNKVAFVGAMTTDLIYNASKAGVQLYVTGQIRKQAMKAVVETGMSIIAVGHARSEYYGLKLLGQILLTKWPDLHIALAKR